MDTSQFLNRNSLKIALVVLVIVIIGMMATGAGYAYSDSPEFCGSCHSMEQAHSTWQMSNHKHLTCTECHLPHQNLAIKLITKATTGYEPTYTMRKVILDGDSRSCLILRAFARPSVMV